VGELLIVNCEWSIVNVGVGLAIGVLVAGTAVSVGRGVAVDGGLIWVGTAVLVGETAIGALVAWAMAVGAGVGSAGFAQADR